MPPGKLTQLDFSAEMDHSAAQALDDRIRRRVIAGEQPTRTSAYIFSDEEGPRIILASLYAGEADEPFADLARKTVIVGFGAKDAHSSDDAT